MRRFSARRPWRSRSAERGREANGSFAKKCGVVRPRIFLRTFLRAFGIGAESALNRESFVCGRNRRVFAPPFGSPSACDANCGKLSAQPGRRLRRETKRRGLRKGNCTAHSVPARIRVSAPFHLRRRDKRRMELRRYPFAAARTGARLRRSPRRNRLGGGLFRQTEIGAGSALSKKFIYSFKSADFTNINPK